MPKMHLKITKCCPSNG